MKNTKIIFFFLCAFAPLRAIILSSSFVRVHFTYLEDHSYRRAFFSLHNDLTADVIGLIAAEIAGGGLRLEGGDHQVAELANAQVICIADPGYAGRIAVRPDQNVDRRDLAEVVAALAGGIVILVTDEGKGRVANPGLQAAAHGAYLVTPVVGVEHAVYAGGKDQDVVVRQASKDRYERCLKIRYKTAVCRH